jgi:hypothetical protein
MNNHAIVEKLRHAYLSERVSFPREREDLIGLDNIGTADGLEWIERAMKNMVWNERAGWWRGIVGEGWRQGGLRKEG